MTSSCSFILQVSHFKSFRVFLIFVPKRPIFRTIQATLQMEQFITFVFKFKSNFLVEMSLLLFDCCFCHGSPGFNVVCTSCIISYHSIETVEILFILHFFRFIIIYIGNYCVEILTAISFFSVSFPFHSIFQFRSFRQSCPVAQYFLSQ